MNIIVCIKQVPGTNKVEVDEKTGVLKRNGVDSKMNPYDLYALETALRLKENVGGKISVITMGPPQAKEVILEAFSMGADEGYLLTDRGFAGADVLATSKAISEGIKKIGEYDLIICGKQTTDGDTAQVGAETAEWLKIPSVSNVSEIVSSSDKSICVKIDMENVTQTTEISYPCLISVDKDIYVPRLPSYLKKVASADREIHVITMEDLEDKDKNTYGLSGSPTKVKSIFPPLGKGKRQLWTESNEELTEKMYSKLKELKFI